jgi:hypothetical protein
MMAEDDVLVQPLEMSAQASQRRGGSIAKGCAAWAVAAVALRGLGARITEG